MNEKLIVEPKYVMVKDMDYAGDIKYGKFNGTRYLMDDGDEYFGETLQSEYDAIFSDEPFT